MMRRKPWRWTWTLIVGVCSARVAGADVSGSSEGQLVAKKLALPVAVAGVLSQSAAVVTGTLAVGGDPGFAGAYVVYGRATPKRLKVRGAQNGVGVSWRAKIVGETLQGRAQLKGPGVKVAGTLTLVRNPPLGDGSGCDAIFTAHETFFADQVLGGALTTCTACHVPGGQAGATRFHVDLADAIATARSIAPLVDSANPDGSRILVKPLALVPHGGGPQIIAGSSEDLTLRQWVGIIAAAGCN